ncbi:MAG: PepSY-like domain-containing protein [Planctomycetota bacterium]
MKKFLLRRIKMRRKNFMFAAIILLMGVFVCLSAYADKKNKGRKVKLPAPVKAAVESLFPQAEIEKVKLEKEGLKVYEIEVEQAGQEYEVTVAPDGIIIEKEKEIDIKTLPEAIKTALAGTEIEEAKREVEYYVITLTKLDNPRVTYEVETEQNGKEIEIEFSADGTVLKQKEDDNNNDDDDDNDDDNDDDEDDDDEDDD